MGLYARRKHPYKGLVDEHAPTLPVGLQQTGIKVAPANYSQWFVEDIEAYKGKNAA